MSVFEVIALLLTLTALFSYVNYRFIKLPTTIGVMLIALVGSLTLISLQRFGFDIATMTARILQGVDFNQTLLQGILSFLLFAGALHVNVNDLAEQKWVVAILAVVGVLISTMIFGTAVYLIFAWLNLKLSYAGALLFGALISPTDPIAVLGILKTANVPKSLEIQIAGESLFNDGVGIAVFVVLHEIAVRGEQPSLSHIGTIFLQEAVGGALIGLFLGWVAYRLLKSVDHYQVEVLLTLALVTGGYSLASALHTSGPIAIVCAGVLIGNHGRRLAMSDTTREHLDAFWELVDEILNALLFVLIGLEVLVLTFSHELLFAGLLTIPAMLLARWVSVGTPVLVMSLWHRFPVGTVTIMTWAGLRGGISVALALSLPAGSERELVLTTTYVLVVFSILGQGLTIKQVVRRAVRS